MSFEIGAESLPRRHPRRPTNRVDSFYPGLGATGATASWMQGLPGAGNDKDKTRIAYAKRDHGLAISPRNDVTAYKNLQSQATGSATAVGKAWYRAALADVQSARAVVVPVAAPKPVPQAPLVNPILTKPVFFQPPAGGFPVLVNPIVKQATDMGLKVQETSDGSVVAVNSDGAVVSKPLPVPISMVTDKTVLPADAVQANAPPLSRTPGVFSIFDKLKDALTSPSSSGGSSFVQSQGPPVAPTTDNAPTYAAADMGAGGALGELFKNPAVIVGVALAFYLLFASSSGRR